jgi:hypothetical protein
MEKNCSSLLQNEYVHKARDENVFIYNLRRTVPLFISRNVFEEKILPNVSEEGKKTLIAYYELPKLKGFRFSPGVNDDYYVLKSVILKINKKIFMSLEENDQQFLLNFYNDHNGRYYVIKKFDISEEDENKILKIFDMRQAYISDEKKKIIADILEPIQGLEKKDKFYGNIRVDNTHVFFFEHILDHVPLLMLLESSRQFSVACSHIFGRVPVKDFQIILSKLDAQFFGFVELQYPVKLCGEIIAKKCKRDGEWTALEMDLTVLQNSNILSKFHFSGTGLNTKLFERLRHTKYRVMENYRFSPCLKHPYQFYLRTGKTKDYLESKLLDISFNGLKVLINKEELNDLCVDDLFEFYMIFSGRHLINGKCKLKWLAGDNGTSQLGLHIEEISAKDKEELERSIEHCCYVMENREMF